MKIEAKFVWLMSLIFVIMIANIFVIGYYDMKGFNTIPYIIMMILFILFGFALGRFTKDKRIFGVKKNE